uniref:Uncharacterized protein n=1 Tax=Setaria viridis TaxID=4556 RepID=A0A4U6VQ22_SETVI|nr:hypothetical protein SEVIR_3G423300v2 [Setaria viridis]
METPLTSAFQCRTSTAPPPSMLGSPLLLPLVGCYVGHGSSVGIDLDLSFKSSSAIKLTFLETWELSFWIKVTS